MVLDALALASVKDFCERDTSSHCLPGFESNHPFELCLFDLPLPDLDGATGEGLPDAAGIFGKFHQRVVLPTNITWG